MEFSVILFLIYLSGVMLFVGGGIAYELTDNKMILSALRVSIAVGVMIGVSSVIAQASEDRRSDSIEKNKTCKRCGYQAMESK